MAKQVWAVDCNYKRKDLKELIDLVSNDLDKAKAAAERRMAIYDAQPKLVRQCIGENGMGTGNHFKNLKTTRQKCDAIHKMRQIKLERTSVLLTY